MASRAARCLLPMLFLAAPLTSLEAQDVKGSADHPLFPTRMPGFTISNYQTEGYGSYRFRGKTPTLIEGKYTRIHYYLQDLSKHPGGLAIRRNYENAVKSIGGEVIFSDPSSVVMKVTHNGIETWAEILATSGRIYFLNIVERTAMAQVISADAMAAALAGIGFVALDIHFETGKATILPESQPQLEQIVALLAKERTWRVGVEGHTDNTGTAAGNRALSDARARSVVTALVERGVDRARLDPVGHGQEMPVADNRLEEGRAKNRRVEIVKRQP
jgi:OOP family OmpA-OmpF porin